MERLQKYRTGLTKCMAVRAIKSNNYCFGNILILYKYMFWGTPQMRDIFQKLKY
jgi:hypothetical protein